MNKVWLIAGLLLSLAVVLAACGGGATPTPAPTPAATPAATPTATPAPAPAPGGVATGKELFTNLGCLGCHRTNGEGGAIGPSLKGLFGSQRELADGTTVTANRDYIEQSITDPGARVAKGFTKGIMPAFTQLSPEQIDQLIEFIESLR